ncbi:hypothetical protein AeRB84_019227 [Aphanomyces euteiches]|nr:hypothetical protein AeRB84_019227 [Aphanomyces euteiches]
MDSPRRGDSSNDYVRSEWHTTHLAMKLKFPVPANFFRCPPLSPDEYAQLLTKSSANAIDLIKHCDIEGRGPLDWTLESDTRDLRIFTANDPSLPPHVLSYAGVVEVQASLLEVASLFQTHTTDMYRDFRRRFARDLVDGQNLYVLEQPSLAHPLKAVNIKWTVNEMPGGGLIRHRDWCFLESMHEFELNGRRGWVRAIYSTQLRCCPDLEATLGTIRGFFYRSGHVFIETDRPGILRGTLLFQASLNGGFEKGHVPTWVVKAGVRRRIRGLSDIHDFIREKRLSQGGILDSWELVDKSARSRCYLCSKKFNTFVRKTRCRKCGEVVCHSCCKKWTISVGGIETPIRACSACSLGLVSKVGTLVPADSDAFQSSVQSLPRHPQSEGEWSGSEDYEVSAIATQRPMPPPAPIRRSKSAYDPPEPDNDMFEFTASTSSYRTSYQDDEIQLGLRGAKSRPASHPSSSSRLPQQPAVLMEDDTYSSRGTIVLGEPSRTDASPWIQSEIQWKY